MKGASDRDRRLAEAMALHRAGRLAEARAIYEDVLAGTPGDAEARHLLGLALFQSGDGEAGLAEVSRAIALRDDVAQFHANWGRIATALGRHAEAADAYARALALAPNDAAAVSDLAAARIKLGDPTAARDAARRAIALDAALPQAHHNLGLALEILGETADAEAEFARAAELDPGFADAHQSLGQRLQARGAFETAAESYRRAAIARPGFVEALTNFGLVRAAQGMRAEAIAAFREALGHDPRQAATHSNLGVALVEEGDLDGALAAFGRAVELAPGDAEIRRNRALALLLAGRLQEGFAEYVWRWQTKHFQPIAYPRPMPAWAGEDVCGRRVLVHCEQGLGDSIHFARYLPLLAARGAEVVLECPDALAPLLGSVAGVFRTVAPKAAAGPCDFHAGMFDLPRMFKTGATTIPADVPYFATDPTRVQVSAGKLPPKRGFRVGLAWRGSAINPRDAQRSPGLAAFAPLFDVPGCEFVSLQKEKGADDIVRLGLSARIIDPMGGVRDFADSAALVAALDLVIACDTAIAHLAGALAKPVWIALPFVPDWRWGMTAETSAWYPTARLFRQQAHGDWAEVFKRIAAALTAYRT